jgi:hypothetical protein
MRRFPGADD